MSKYLPEHGEKPVAVLTAFRGSLFHDWPGKENPMSPEEVMRHNRKANEKLLSNIRSRGMSHYPVTGVGQEPKDGMMQFNKEDSIVIQPQGKMDEDAFVNNVKSILFNPALENTALPQHQQWGAAVYLPSQDEAFLLFCPAIEAGDRASSPADYTGMKPIGKARPTRQGDDAMTQLNYGPVATPPPGMIQPNEPPSEKHVGRRFTVSREP